MTHKSVLLDTSFFLRFLNDSSPLFKNADGYFRYFIEKEIAMLISTIPVAEYCTGGDINELPLRNLQILPFNLNHSKRTGKLARIVFQKKEKLKLAERNIIPNDAKLFAQADSERTINFYLLSDTESLKIFNLLKQETQLKFQFLNLSIPHTQVFGLLGFEE